MPGFDGEIAKLAQRVLVNPRRIDWHTGVLATKVTPGTPERSWCQQAWRVPAWLPQISFDYLLPSVLSPATHCSTFEIGGTLRS